MILSKRNNPHMFEKIRWLGLARSRDEYREALQHLVVEKERAYTTDGARLHIINEALNLEEGFYRFEKFTKSQVVIVKLEDEPDWKYPNVEGIYKPDDLKRTKNKVHLYHNQDADVAICTINRALWYEDCMNFYFLEHVISPEFVEFDVYIRKQGQAVYFEHPIYRAVIMPKVYKREGTYAGRNKSSSKNGKSSTSGAGRTGSKVAGKK